MSSVIDLVLVDFDDTIVDTHPRFAQARRDLFALLDRAGYTAAEAERLHHEEIDPVMRERLGFGPQRLEHTFLATYERMREAAGHEVDEALAEQCAALGRAVAGTPPAFAGAVQALRRLAARHPTVLYTQSGNPHYQLSCVRETGILDILPEERVRIASGKGTSDFLATLDTYGIRDPARVWMVGNSMRSDINPALEAGARAILVESPEPWHYDLVEPYSDDYLRAPDFVAAVNILLAF